VASAASTRLSFLSIHRKATGVVVRIDILQGAQALGHHGRILAGAEFDIDQFFPQIARTGSTVLHVALRLREHHLHIVQHQRKAQHAQGHCNGAQRDGGKRHQTEGATILLRFVINAHLPVVY